MKGINFVSIGLVLSLIGCPVAADEAKLLGGTKIVGGEPTTIAEHPWQAALIASRSDGSFLCGGSIVSERWILTAAHCFGADGSFAQANVKVNATKYETEGSWMSSKKVIVNEAYDPKTNEHDIALVEVESTSPGLVIPLAAPSTKLAVGENLIVTGWGATTEGGNGSSVLLKVAVPYVDRDTCNATDSYNGAIGPGMLCAGNPGGGADSCQGDSGGPIVKGANPQSAILVGVVSFGEGCARALKYGVYTSVAAERQWIVDSIQN